jgi:hypothetical protein
MLKPQGMDLRVNRVSKEKLDLKVCKENKVFREMLAHKENKASKEKLDHKVYKGNKVIREMLAHKGNKASKEKQAFKDYRVNREFRVFLEHKDYKGSKAFRDYKEFKVFPEMMDFYLMVLKLEIPLFGTVPNGLLIIIIYLMQVEISVLELPHLLQNLKFPVVILP